MEAVKIEAKGFVANERWYGYDFNVPGRAQRWRAFGRTMEKAKERAKQMLKDYFFDAPFVVIHDDTVIEMWKAGTSTEQRLFTDGRPSLSDPDDGYRPIANSPPPASRLPSIDISTTVAIAEASQIEDRLSRKPRPWKIGHNVQGEFFTVLDGEGIYVLTAKNLKIAEKVIDAVNRGSP